MSRTEGKIKLMDELFSQVKHLRPPDASELKGKQYCSIQLFFFVEKFS